jgi:hypothetical protein
MMNDKHRTHDIRRPSSVARRPFIVYHLSFIILFTASSLRADVFWRMPKTPDAVLAGLGGARVYTTDVEVNGRPGTLAAYALGLAPGAAGARLARALGLPASAAQEAALLTDARGGRVRRLLVLPSPAAPEACVVLAFDQPQASAADARSKPPAWPEGLPALAAEPLFTAVCAKTRAAFVTAETGASPEDAARDAAHTLRGAGWTEATPSTPVFKLFVSGRKQCVLFAQRAPRSERTAISLLQREGASP